MGTATSCSNGEYLDAAANCRGATSGILGCFSDGGSYTNLMPRDLPFVVQTSSSTNTLESCARDCAGSGFKYFGAQNGNQCYCGDLFGHNGLSSSCNVPCSGDSQEICGGLHDNTIGVVAYFVPPSPTSAPTDTVTPTAAPTQTEKPTSVPTNTATPTSVPTAAGTCPTSTNCATYLKTPTCGCKTCKSGYKLENTWSYKCVPCQSSTYHCKAYLASTDPTTCLCKSCQTGYTLSGTVCGITPA